MGATIWPLARVRNAHMDVKLTLLCEDFRALFACIFGEMRILVIGNAALFANGDSLGAALETTAPRGSVILDRKRVLFTSDFYHFELFGC